MKQPVFGMYVSMARIAFIVAARKRAHTKQAYQPFGAHALILHGIAAYRAIRAWLGYLKKQV
jgi:hypothetical protein